MMMCEISLGLSCFSLGIGIANLLWIFVLSRCVE